MSNKSRIMRCMNHNRWQDAWQWGDTHPISVLYCPICEREKRADKPKKPKETLESLEAKVARYIKQHNLHNPKNKLRYCFNELNISIRKSEGDFICRVSNKKDLQNAFNILKHRIRETMKPSCYDNMTFDKVEIVTKSDDKWIHLKSMLPKDSAERKTYPIFTGALKYFPRAIAAVANQSYKGNQKHHPDKPLHWDKPKSSDHEDCLVRHLMDSLDPTCDKQEELTAVAWRALALLETYLEGDDE